MTAARATGPNKRGGSKAGQRTIEGEMSAGF
jgi:hypothetical protein